MSARVAVRDWTLTAEARERLGEAASELVEDRGRLYGANRDVLIPEDDYVSEDVEDTLTREYGQPATIDRGELAYWRIPQSDWIES